MFGVFSEVFNRSSSGVGAVTSIGGSAISAVGTATAQLAVAAVQCHRGRGDGHPAPL